MPFRDSLSSLHDIYEAIQSIERFILGMDFSIFKADEKTNAAVERKLLLLSEAARRLGDDAEKLCPGIPWNNIRGIGNWLRHQYDRVDPSVIWLTVERDPAAPEARRREGFGFLQPRTTGPALG